MAPWRFPLCVESSELPTLSWSSEDSKRPQASAPGAGYVKGPETAGSASSQGPDSSCPALRLLPAEQLLWVSVPQGWERVYSSSGALSCQPCEVVDGRVMGRVQPPDVFVGSSW